MAQADGNGGPHTTAGSPTAAAASPTHSGSTLLDLPTFILAAREQAHRVVSRSPDPGRVERVPRLHRPARGVRRGRLRLHRPCGCSPTSRTRRCTGSWSWQCGAGGRGPAILRRAPEIRSRRLAFNRGVTFADAFAVATPVLASDGSPIAAISAAVAPQTGIVSTMSARSSGRQSPFSRHRPRLIPCKARGPAVALRRCPPARPLSPPRRSALGAQRRACTRRGRVVETGSRLSPLVLQGAPARDIAPRPAVAAALAHASIDLQQQEGCVVGAVARWLGVGKQCVDDVVQRPGGFGEDGREVGKGGFGIGAGVSMSPSV